MKVTYPVDDYLAYSNRLSGTEVRCREEFAAWLPERIIDVHVHTCLSEHLLEQPPEIRRKPFTTFPYFSLEDSRDMDELLFPRTQIVHLRFGMPIHGYDLRATNRYLLDNCQSPDMVAMVGIPTDPAYTISVFQRDDVRALKMYPFFFPEGAERIAEFFPDEVLRAASELGKPIILHLPLPINRSESVDDLRRTLDQFESLKVILAHMGRAFIAMPGVEEAFESLSGYKNLWLDTAMVTSSEVIRCGLETFGVDRVLYGSDQPINFARWCEVIDEELGPRLITLYKYHWVVDEVNDRHVDGLNEVSHIVWQELVAIREVVESSADPERVKQAIFYDNAAALL